MPLMRGIVYDWIPADRARPHLGCWVSVRSAKGSASISGWLVGLTGTHIVVKPIADDIIEIRAVGAQFRIGNPMEKLDLVVLRDGTRAAVLEVDGPREAVVQTADGERRITLDDLKPIHECMVQPDEAATELRRRARLRAAGEVVHEANHPLHLLSDSDLRRRIAGRKIPSLDTREGGR